MSRTTHLAVLAVLAPLAPLAPLAACGDDAASTTPTSVNAAYVQALCKTFRACDGADDLGRWNIFAEASTLAACEATLTPIMKAAVDYDAEVAAGRRVLDRPRFEACLAASVSTCTVPQACLAALSGTTALGQACDASADCVAGAFCAEEGLCTAAAALGQPCEGPDESCSQAAGRAICGHSDLTSQDPPAVCTKVVTEADAKAGAQCAEWFDGTSERVVSCGAGLHCAYDTLTAAHCTAVVADGAACAGTGECASHSACVGTGPAAVCKPVVVQTEAGAACDLVAGTLTFCSVFDGLACSQSKCATIGDGTAGSACNPELDDLIPDSCGSGLACGDDGRCAAASE